MDWRPLQHQPRPLVLIVEGHEETRALYAIALLASGFNVVAAQDGADAYGRAWSIHPDIIVADLPMPNFDGWQFLRDLKEHPSTRDIPVVAVTGRGQESAQERAERDGVAAFFARPCLPDELAAGLRRVLDAQTDTSAAD